MFRQKYFRIIIEVFDPIESRVMKKLKPKTEKIVQKFTVLVKFFDQFLNF